jgi:nitrite reductase (NADH) large subunit
MDYLKQVVIDDSLGLCSEFEAEMDRQVATYQCEWATTIADPVKLQRFSHFVNSDQPDPSLIRIEERGQTRPPLDHEKSLAAQGL